jgi:uncharacterized protein (DUF302 family)
MPKIGPTKNTIMSYYFSRILRMPFDEAVQRLKCTLQEQGFGVITTIDVKDTLKQKLNIPFRKYQILGACHPELAYKAITLESHLGVILPCNLAVQERENGEVEVSAVNPLQATDHVTSLPQLAAIAQEVANRLRAAVDDIPRVGHAPRRRDALPDHGGRHMSLLPIG